MAVDQTSLDRIRNATFPPRGGLRQARGREVPRPAGRLARDRRRGRVPLRHGQARARAVGERTGAILSQAEESAQQIRGEAEEEARGARSTAANLEAADEQRSEARLADLRARPPERGACGGGRGRRATRSRPRRRRRAGSSRRGPAPRGHRGRDRRPGPPPRRRAGRHRGAEREADRGRRRHRRGLELPEPADARDPRTTTRARGDGGVEQRSSRSGEDAETEDAAAPEETEQTVTDEREAAAEPRPEHEAGPETLRRA